jgi:hypothetical protein
MTAPSPTIFTDNIGSVDADSLNTFVQACLNFAQMRTFSGLSNMAVCVLGAVAPRDGGQGCFYWNPTIGALEDDNSTIIVPSGNMYGGWVRLTGS